MAEKPYETIIEEYKNFITTEFLDKFGSSYQSPASIGDSWREITNYSPIAEKFLISKSTLFLRTLNYADSKSTDPHYLRGLTNRMAKYLSLYIMQENEFDPNERASKRAARTIATDKLKLALYDENPYIQTLLNRQSAKRNLREKHPDSYSHIIRRNEKQKSARRDYSIACEVQSMFMECRQYKKR